MDKRLFAETNDPWLLLSRAENWCKVGLLNEAVIASDEAIEMGLKEIFNELGVPQPARLEDTINILEEEGMKFSAQKLLHLRELRDRAERGEEDNLTAFDVEESISEAESFLSKIDDQRERLRQRDVSSQCKGTSSRRKGTTFYKHSGGEEAASLLMLSTLDSRGPLSHSRRDAGQGELEFFTKLLLARAILNFKKRRMPHLIGLLIALLSGAVCCLLAAIGGYGVILMLTGQSFFSIFGLIFDCMLLFVSYLFLKITIYVRNGTR
nr:hypothetical protein [Candidatus Njordarchaeota archaeon]